jgi:hypothetical protein
MTLTVRGKRLAAAAAVAVATLGIGGLAFGYFTSTNSGSGSGPVADASPWTLTSVTVSGLAPGVAPQKIHGTATNALSETEYIGTVTPTVTSTTNVGCTAADFTVTPGVINASVASGTTGLTFGTIAFNDLPSNQNACQGVTVSLSFTSI